MDIVVGDVFHQAGARHGVDALDFSEQVAGQVEYVRGLFDDLAAALGQYSPPRHPGHAAGPSAEGKTHRLVAEAFARFSGCIHVAPVVAHGADQVLAADGRFNGAGLFQGSRHGFFHENRQAALNGRQLGLRVGKRRQADIDRVQCLAVVQSLVMAIGLAAVFGDRC